MASRFFIVVGVAGMLGALTASACKGESDGGDSGTGASSSGGASSGGASNGGSSSGTAPTGGTSGNASGGRGGSSGSATGGTDTTGGAAGESGGESGGGDSSGGSSGAMGGMTPTGGATPGGSGGSPGGAGAGLGGFGGSGGGGAAGGAAGSVGILGEPCSPRGALACAGNHQKLTVLCGGDDEWQPNQTCGDGQFCDSLPGPNVGTCRPELPECAEGAGTKWCDDDAKTLVTCGPDLVSTVNQVCDGACHDDACSDVSDCPTWADHDVGVACSLDCGAGNRTCSRDSIGCAIFGFSLPQGGSAVIRTAWADETCMDCQGATAFMRFQVVSTADYVRVTVPPPWRVGTLGTNFCTQSTQCLVTTASSYIALTSTGMEGVPVNVLVEEVDSTAACP